MAIQPGTDGTVVIEKSGLQLFGKLSDGLHTISLRGEMDLSNADVLSRELRRGIDCDARILIDMSSLEFIDSHGLRALVTAADGLTEKQRLEVVRPPIEVARMLSLTGIDRRLRYIR